MRLYEVLHSTCVMYLKLKFGNYVQNKQFFTTSQQKRISRSTKFCAKIILSKALKCQINQSSYHQISPVAATFRIKSTLINVPITSSCIRIVKLQNFLNFTSPIHQLPQIYYELAFVSPVVTHFLMIKSLNSLNNYLQKMLAFF